MAEAAKGGERRRCAWKRIWQRLRDAVKAPKIALPKSTKREPMAEPQPPSAAVTTTAEPINSAERVADWQPSYATLAIITPSLLVADDSTDDSADVLVPMLSTQTNLSSERAQKLFERYGIKFEPRTTQDNEVAREVRRVEKPIRVRVHYSCEECGTAFATNRTCEQCGHRRCRDCPRNPPKRMREVLNEARQQQLRERQRRQEQAHQDVIEQQQPEDDSMTINAAPATDVAPQSGSSQPSTTEQEGLLSVDSTETSHDQYVMQHRPRAGVQLLLRARARLAPRICHECQTHFQPANPSICQTCNHLYCETCEYETLEAMTHDLPAVETQQSTHTSSRIPSVQRVYRKPRQRVRWTCDQCEALFTDRDRCQECGHRKCEDCIRSPPRRTPRPPDPPPEPEIVETAAEKLSVSDEPSSSSQPAASSAT